MTVIEFAEKRLNESCLNDNKDEKARLTLKDNNAYTLSDTPCIQDGYSMETQVRVR